jgi:hypothetical protein
MSRLSFVNRIILFRREHEHVKSGASSSAAQ